MVRNEDNLATGFLGPVNGWGSLVPAAQRSLRLPFEVEAWRAGAYGEASLDLIEVDALTESMGRVEDAFAGFAQQLRAGGALLVDVENLQSSRMLRMVIDGRAGSFDPIGDPKDPSQPLLLRRALAAAAAAGLSVRDVLQVPSGAKEFPTKLTEHLFSAGLMPADWLHGQPAARFWLQLEKAPQKAGSVLIAGGDENTRAQTEAAVRAFLPEDWEVVAADAVGERAQWNRAVAAARGEIVWFLRAGTEPRASDFESMLPRASINVVVPARDGAPIAGGDLAGTMMPRLDVLLVGPICEQTTNTQVALEDYAMRMESKLSPALAVDVAFAQQPAPIEAPEQFAADSQELFDRWSILDGASQFDKHSDEGCEEDAPEAPWAGRAPRITLCMIARDEERFLGQCLEHARDAFDELVLVDTGSKDRTVEIAESFGAKVLHEVWDDDFSTPRNKGLEAATGDWILVLDADEFIKDDGCQRIREAVQNPTALGYDLRFTNLYTSGKTVGVMMVRLFRNLPDIAYKNIIHEQITPSLQAVGGPQGLRMLSSDIEVEHHGYTEQVIDDRGKNERNERLFRKQMEQQPDDIYGLYKYGDFLRRMPERADDARRLLTRSFELILEAPPAIRRGLPYASEIAALCAIEHERAGDMDRAREFVEIALRRFVPTPNLHYIAASFAIADGDSEVAIEHYRRCLAYLGKVLVVPIQEGITSYVSLTGIAQAWLLRGDRARALPLLEQALAIEPGYEVAHLAMSKLHLQNGDIQRALSVLTTYLAAHPESLGACQQTTWLLHQIGRDDAARKLGRHTVRLLEERRLDREASALNELLAQI